MMALRVINSIYEQNKQVPNDYSIVSYDNTIYPYIFGIELTSVKQDVKKLSSSAFELLYKKITGSVGTEKEICLQPELIVRNSVKALNH